MEIKQESNENLEPDRSNIEKTDPNLKPNIDSDNIQTATATLDSIGAELTNSMPEVQQHAIDQELENKSESTAKFSHLTDKNGDGFDPKRHKTKRDGSPTVSKLGKLMLKPNAKKHDSTKPEQASTAQYAGQLDDIKPELSDAEKQQCTALGKVSANMIFAAGRMLGGEEWQPVKQQGYDEASALEQAFADYYIASGKTEMSPAAGLGMALCAYALPRFTMPETKKKTASLSKRVFAWWHNRRGKREQTAAHSAEQLRKDSEKKETIFEA
jgi:hypothetical protein